MSQENEIRIKLTPRTPTEVLYQQTVDDLRKTIAELREQLANYRAILRCAAGHVHNGKYGDGCPACQLQRERAVSNELVVALKVVTDAYDPDKDPPRVTTNDIRRQCRAALAQHAALRGV